VRPTGEINEASPQVLDELNEFGIQFLRQRETMDTEGPPGRAIIVIVSAIAELERSLIVKRVRAGTRGAKIRGKANRSSAIGYQSGASCD
jgi:DNA invertase Pin-like site-specific DNA recombinase